MRARVIVNRRARRLASEGRLLEEIRRPRAGIDVVETTSPDELEPLFREMGREMARETGRRLDGPVVVLAGGDGSYMQGVTALEHAFGDGELPPIAFVAGGTVGTIARNWGVSGEPVRYARRLLDDLSTGRRPITRRPTLRVIERGGRERIGFIFGAGLVARFFELYEAAGAGGNVAAAKIVARIFAGSFVGSRTARAVLEPAACSLEVDGAPASFDRLSLLCASVVPNLGLGMRLTYRAGQALDRFHVVATPLGPRLLGPQMPLVLAAKPLLGERVDELAHEIDLRFPESRGAYVLDGDLFRADDVTVKVGPVIDLVG